MNVPALVKSLEIISGDNDYELDVARHLLRRHIAGPVCRSAKKSICEGISASEYIDLDKKIRIITFQEFCCSKHLKMSIS